MKYKLWLLMLVLLSCWLTSYAAPLLPGHLQVGDTVGLISSAFRAPDDADIRYATERLQALGLRVKYGKFIFNHDRYFAGTDRERAQGVPVQIDADRGTITLLQPAVKKA
jgi:hypothetical protein